MSEDVRFGFGEIHTDLDPDNSLTLPANIRGDKEILTDSGWKLGPNPEPNDDLHRQVEPPAGAITGFLNGDRNRFVFDPKTGVGVVVDTIEDSVGKVDCIMVFDDFSRLADD